MNIFLGLWLDSATYPDALGDKEAAEGTVVTGFKGLIGILETKLGLVSPATSENLRIAEWQDRIRRLDTGNFPFSKSFATDSWNTAKELLRRRDELILSGWDPHIHGEGSKWLDTLAKLELTRPNTTGGFSDRVRILLSQLQKTVTLHINQITIVDKEETLWDPWAIQLLELVKQQGVKVVRGIHQKEDPVEPTSNTDLAKLKVAITGKITPQEASGDGSLVFIRADQELDAADFLISWLQENDMEGTVLIKGEGSLLLDELLHRRGVARAGVDVDSKWRAVLQVLPLTIDTYWQPLKIERLLELLTIPTSPVPGLIRYKLANALTSSPGIGGPEWKQAIEDGINDYEERWLSEGLDEHELKRRRKDLETKLDLWVRHDYYDINEGIPYEKLALICQKVSQWATGHFQMTDDPMYLQAAQIALEVMEGIKTLGTNNISHLQVARILDSVIGEGAKLSNHYQEGSKWQVVNHPGEIWGTADTILWWGFNKKNAGPSIRTWTVKEREWLKQRGVNLVSEDVHRQREASGWHQAVRFANRRLILIAPSKVKGEELPTHPLWDEIRYAVARDFRTEKKITFDATKLRKAQSFVWFEKEWQRNTLNLQGLPGPMRTWRVPENRVLPRSEESATSFEGLMGCPLKWTLRYAANLKPGNILSLPNQSIMLGNLAHMILEKLITEKTSWSKEEVMVRSAELFDELVPMIAAPLLEPQNGILRNETRSKLQKSLQQFFTVLNKAGIEIQHTELELEKTWCDGVNFKGRLDLVGKTRAGSKIFFDAKWSGKPTNYKKRLENLSVQLSLYHWLLADHENEELPVAYFMLRSGDFFSLPHDDFPSDYHVAGPSLIESYKKVRQSVENVWSMLSKGAVIAPGVPPEAETAGESSGGEENSEASFVPSIDPPCTFCEYQNLCGVRRVTQ